MSTNQCKAIVKYGCKKGTTCGISTKSGDYCGRHQSCKPVVVNEVWVDYENYTGTLTFIEPIVFKFSQK